MVKDIWDRDKKKREYIRSNGWRVLRFWECEINKDILCCGDRIVEAIKNGQTYDQNK